MYEDLENLEAKYKIMEFPLNIAIEVTNRCNLNCIMCSNDKLTRSRGFMTMETYKKIIDEIAIESPGTRIWLDFYGEALLAGYKLYYMIDYAKKSGVNNVCINTNGTLLKPEFSEMLLDSGVDYISIDCDGFTKEVYESIRVGGNRDVFYSNIEYLLQRKKERKSNVIIDVKVIEMEENRKEVEQIIDYWQKRGAWTAVRREASWNGNVRKEHEFTKTDRIVCGHAVGICAITWDGDIAGCVWDANADVKCGNVNDMTIKSIWKKRNEEFVKLHFEHRWDELNEQCRNCENWRIVGENRYDENGNPINRNYKLKDKIF